MPARPRIEAAVPGDAAAIAAIYGHYVRHGCESFEIDPPGAAQMAARIAGIQAAGAPWLVAREDGGGIAGYAYAGQFRDRAAYRFACEDSIYLHPDRRGQGLGGALLAALIAAAQASGFRQMVAVIAAAAGENPVSVALHARAGFRHAGRLAAMGRKHGRWLDTIYMQRALGPGAGTPPAMPLPPEEETP